jgi:hypothetical protein
MDWKDIAGIVGRAAPILGTLVGGPAGAAIGGLISSALGTAATPDAIQQAIATDPQAALKLQMLVEDNKSKFDSLIITHSETMYASEVADRVSARKTAVDGGTAKPLFYLSMLLLTICLGSEVTVLFVGYPTSIPDLVIGRVLGLLDSVALMVLAFHYGSSSSSDRKTELLAKAGPTK